MSTMRVGFVLVSSLLLLDSGLAGSALRGGNVNKLRQSAIVVIDMQNDFVQPNGSLSNRGANRDLIQPVNTLLDLDWGLRIFTADNHPHNHVSFATNYPSNYPSTPNGPFPIVNLTYSKLSSHTSTRICGAEHIEKYGNAGAICNGFPTPSGEVFSPDVTVPQETYPPHAVQGTWGQKIAEGLKFSYDDPKDHLILKGQNAHIDSYSAVFNNLACDGAVTTDASSGEPNSLTCIPKERPFPHETNLPDLLRVSGVKDVYFVGLCLDYCVKYSSIHTAFLGAEAGWNTYVIEDASRPCSPSTFHQSQSKQQMMDSGVKLVSIETVTA